ncbi:MAG: aldolase/citrate lyase family protein, partial [Pseudomonadales bacterium]
GIQGYETAQSPVSDAEAHIARLMFERVSTKLASEAVEDHRVDFEDGYGSRPDAEEEQHAFAAATAMAEGLAAGTLPSQVGLRIKALTEEARVRALQTLDIFITTLAASGHGLPLRFVVTLPKVTCEAQVEALADCLDLLEQRCGLEAGAIQIELMIETVQSMLTAAGEIRIPALVTAGRGRVSCAILGTFDYTASCNIASNYQDHRHPAADFARNLMQVCLTGTPVTLCDGITNIMPIGPHRPDRDGSLSATQLEENRQVVRGAWQVHFNNVMHSLKRGYYQGWDLNPAQIPARFAAVYYFFLTGLDDATARLKTFVDRAAQASLVGNTFDDADTGQGLVNFFVSGLNCGALTEEDVVRTGITLDELKGRSFLRIVENRTQATE